MEVPVALKDDVVKIICDQHCRSMDFTIAGLNSKINPGSKSIKALN